MVQTNGKEQVYSAIADVEIQAKPNPFGALETDPGAVVQYEMRGAITITSPVRYGNYTCTAVSPVPVSIKDSHMRTYRGAEYGAGTAYELRILQFVRLSTCTDGSGKVFQPQNESIQVNFDSSYRSTAQSEAELRQIPTPTAEDEAAMKEQQQNAAAAMNDPEVQQALAQLEAMAQSGKTPSQAEMIAIAERLQRNPRVAQMQRPKLSPALEAYGNRPIDYSYLQRTNDPNHLKGEMTLEYGTGRGSQTFSWDLRRVR